MNQYNHLYLGVNYAVLAPGRQIKTKTENHILFTDGSQVDLDTGQVIDLAEQDEKFLVVIPLSQGLNHFNLGDLNTAPKAMAWTSSKLKINYPGPVNIIPSLNEILTVHENKYCTAVKLGTEEVIVTAVAMDEVSYFHDQKNGTNTPNFDYKTKNFPAINIWAPVNTTVTGEATALNFSKLKHIDMKVNIVNGQLATEDIFVDGEGHLSLSLVSTPLIGVNQIGDVNIVTSGQVDKIDVIGTGDVRVICKDAGNISVDAGGEAYVSASNVDGLYIAAAEDVTVNIANNTDFIVVKSDGSININGGKYKEITSLEAEFDISLDVESFEIAVVKCGGNLNVKANIGTQSIAASSKKIAKLTLATANVVDVRAEEISIMAYEYLKDPIVPANNPNNFISYRGA